MIDVVVCDDHPVVRKGLKSILAADREIKSIREAGNAQDLLDLVRDGTCDVVLLDFSLPGRSGLDVLRQIKRERPRLPVLMLSVHPPDQYAVRTLRAGASGYLTKEMAPEELLKAVRTVVTGHKYVTNVVAERLALNVERPSDRPAHETLSDREFEVLRLLALGKSVKQIASELFLSDKTISTYRSRVLTKLGLRTNAELILYSFREGLVE